MEVRNNSGFVNKSGQEYKWDDNIFLEMARSPELSEGRKAVLCPTVLFQGWDIYLLKLGCSSAMRLAGNL